jgi:hypothetical protein
MGEQFNMIAPRAQDHVRKLISRAGFPDNDESLERLAQGWLDKQASFFEQTKKFSMEESSHFDMDDPRGALVMTVSGSLVTLGPLLDGHRSVKYLSIGIRKDVPETIEYGRSILADDIDKDGYVEFEEGPFRRSSPVLSIAVIQKQITALAEQGLLDKATAMLTRDFIDANKTTIVAEQPADEDPEEEQYEEEPHEEEELQIDG